MSPHRRPESPPPDQNLWPRPMRVTRFGPNAQHIRIEATPEERAAIAAAHGCLSIEALAADLEVSRRGERLQVEGELTAEVTQSCVVTLEPVSSRLRERISLSFAPPPEETSRRGRRDESAGEALELDLEAEDPPEPILDGQVDLGAATLEFFALGLDPYPRREGATLPSSAGNDAENHPFAALKRLKDEK